MALMLPNATEDKVHVMFPEHVLSADPEYIEAYLPRPETFAEPVPITNQSYAVMNKMAARRKIRLQKTEARGRMFVTTVSFPVIVNETFMGVAAVNIPLTELNQQAHPSNIGGRSYFFMLDQNGFIMFHPQLRPIDPITKSHKQNYNNMDLLELEVPQTQQIRLSQDKDVTSDIYCEQGTTFAECVDEIRSIVRRMVMDCDNSDPQQLDMLFGTDMLDRVYPQTNSYYSECIDGANFVLGLAVATDDDYRLKQKRKNYDYHNVQMTWMTDKQWKVHPHWHVSFLNSNSLLFQTRYCLLNDTDTNVTKEEAFMIYAEQMKNSGVLPELCRPRRHLVDKLLLDLEATSALQDIWDMQWQFLKDNLIHLVFFTSPSGLIRYYNQTLDDYDYEDPNWNIFDHIGSILSVEHAQESYNHFITDLNRKSVDDTYYRRSVRMKDTIVFDVSNKCVTGFEFAYDYVVNTMGEHGCGPADDRRWCVLLDEHGYVFYSNQRDISYEDYLEDPLNKGKHIGHWFGNINRVSQRAMALLVEKKFYVRLKYIDHQAMCKEAKNTSKSASSLRHTLHHFTMLLKDFLVQSSLISISPIGYVSPRAGKLQLFYTL
uniref:VGCC_alpha2 domain-containing protein n=1 Tax=Heterorhabditis bacteriophora TaxID=37862 RepID=A0A1I7XA73_HETBA